MNSKAAAKARFAEELANFQKTMEELRMLNDVSKDLRRYKKLLQIRKFD